MKEERLIGNNIQLFMHNRDISEEDIAVSLGYSQNDISRILEGRIFLSLNELQDIANYFDIDVEELFDKKSSELYEDAGCIHYIHPFKDQANLDQIMDIFDLICDIEEVL
jgi:transcriptional regulator with XRE-family HTH domain